MVQGGVLVTSRGRAAGVRGRGAALQNQAIFTGHIREPGKIDLKDTNKYKSLGEESHLRAVKEA